MRATRSKNISANNNNQNNVTNNVNKSNINNQNKNSNKSTINNVNNKINNVQRQLNQLTRQMSYRILNRNPFSQSNWYHTRNPGLYQQVNAYHDNALAEYVYGLFHPDAVYRENLNIKAPSILPIPTTNFAFKETFTIAPNSYGNFVLVWSPNYLGSMDRIPVVMKHTQLNGKNTHGYFSNLYFDVSNEVDGNSAATHFKAQTFKHINQQFNKYRLTSACLKVKYTGKVLNQSGMMSACASFMEFPRTAICVPDDTPMTAEYEVPNLYPQLQRIGDFDTIRQGQWAKTVSIVDEPSGITCVYIPTDTLSQAFVDNADTITSKDITDFYPIAPVGCIGTQWYSRSANISFDVCGYGIVGDSTETPCITIETYYNYEIIVNEDQLPYFRPTVPKIETKQAEDVQRITQKVASTVGTITTTKSHEDAGVMGRIRQALNVGRRIYNAIEPYMALTKLGLKLV